MDEVKRSNARGFYPFVDSEHNAIFFRVLLPHPFSIPGDTLTLEQNGVTSIFAYRLVARFCRNATRFRPR